MNTVVQFHDCVRNDTDLVQLEIEIARRADELAKDRVMVHDPNDDWNCWLAAEWEVLGSIHEPAPA